VIIGRRNGSVNREMPVRDALKDRRNPLYHYRTTNQRVTLLLLQPVDRPSTGSAGRVSLPCVSF
jgi:hypothetical protein